MDNRMVLKMVVTTFVPQPRVYMNISPLELDSIRADQKAVRRNTGNRFNPLAVLRGKLAIRKLERTRDKYAMARRRKANQLEMLVLQRRRCSDPLQSAKLDRQVLDMKAEIRAV